MGSIPVRERDSMSIIPPDALSTIQLVSGLVASAKNAVDLAKLSSNRDLQAAVSELLIGVLDVKVRVIDLDEEVRSLKAQLAQRGEINGPDEANGYFFIKSKLDQPLCPKCYQSNPSNTVFLGPMHNFNGGRRRVCAVCGYKRMEVPMKSQTIRMTGW